MGQDDSVTFSVRCKPAIRIDDSHLSDHTDVVTMQNLEAQFTQGESIMYFTDFLLSEQCSSDNN